jgi:hypothetical protein
LNVESQAVDSRDDLREALNRRANSSAEDGIMSFTNNGRDSALRCPRRPKRRIEKVMVSIHFA